MTNIIERCKNGDPDALKSLYKDHVDNVFAMCIKILKNREQAKDATQEVFIKVFSALGSFRSEADPRTWICRVAINHCYDFVKLAKPASLEFDETMGNHASPADQESFEKSPVEKRVREILKTMKKDLAKTFWLSVMGEFSQKEVASIMNVSVSAVKARIKMARKIILKNIVRSKIDSE